MKTKPCKYCNGTGKAMSPMKTGLSLRVSGISFMGNTVKDPCTKCRGTGQRMK